MTKSPIGDLTIHLLTLQNYKYIYDPEISPGGKKPERTVYSEVVLIDQLKHAVNTLNPSIPEETRERVIQEVLHTTSPDTVNLVLAKLEVIDELFKGFDYYEYFPADTSRKLSIILEAEEHFLNLENGKNRLIKEVTHLSQVFAITVPHPKAMVVKEWIDFFQAVK